MRFLISIFSHPPIIIIVISLFFVGCYSEDDLRSARENAFVKLFGGAGNQVAFDMKETLNGEFVLVGSSSSVGAPVTSDVYVVKTDKAGNELWSRFLDIGINDTAYSIEINDAGDYIICGITYFTENDADAFLMRMSPNGDTIWQRTFGESTSTEEARDLILTNDNAIIFVGTSSRIDSSKNGSRPNGTFNPPARTDISDSYWLKVDQNGNQVWQEAKRLGFDGQDTVFSIVQIPNSDRFALAGNSYSNSSLDMYVFFINESGNSFNANEYGDPLVDETAFDLAFLNSGELVLLGNRKESNNNDLLTLAIDNNLNAITLKERQIGGSNGQELGKKIFITPENDLWIIGQTNSEGAGGQDIYLAKLDSSLNIILEETHGWGGDDQGKSILVTQDSLVAICGSSNFGANTMMSLLKGNKEGKLLP